MSRINPNYRTIIGLLQSRSFSIDDYQREYKWDTQNIDELLSDLLNAFERDYSEGDLPNRVPNYGEYFLGSIIVSKRDGKNFLVDGQQRVTSLTLLLIHLYRVASERGLGVASTMSPLISSDSFGQMKFNLDIPERVGALHAMYEGTDYNADNDDESVKTMLARFDDIANSDLEEELGAGFEVFVYWLLHNVGLIEIVTESDQDAYAIFETMNDRGKPLSPTDMLKAYLLAPISTAEARSRANKSWRDIVQSLNNSGDDSHSDRDVDFFKAWLRSQYADSMRERKVDSRDRDWELIGSTYHRWVRDQSEKIGAGSEAGNQEIITKEIPFFARAYHLIISASRTYQPGLEAVFYNAHNDFTWQPTVLLAALDMNDDEETIRRKINATATFLDIWIMRRTVNYIRVAYSSVSYAMFALVRDIRRLQLDELIDVLRAKLDEEEPRIGFHGSPSRHRGGVKDLALNQFSRRYIYHLLARVTAFVEKESGKPDLFATFVDRESKNSLDLEHIWPAKYEPYSNQFESRDEFFAYRDYIGGLLLLPADVNRSFKDKPFETKSLHYAKENLWAASMTKQAYEHAPQFKNFIARHGLNFHPYEEFGREEQWERRELLEQLCELIWSPDRLEKDRPGQ